MYSIFMKFDSIKFFKQDYIDELLLQGNIDQVRNIKFDVVKLMIASNDQK